MEKIYFDYGATTPVDEKVFAVMAPYFLEKFGNASSAHSFGREAREAVEKARQKIADFLGAQTEEIIFTSGATESNNLALKGFVREHFKESKDKIPHLIVSNIEHHCVLDAAKSLKEDSLVEVDFVKVNKDGVVETGELEKLIKENTILVSVMYANNEIGIIQPVKEISEMLRKQNHKIYFHTDAVQAVSYLDCNVSNLGADMLTLSGHKIYGPKGVGALYVRKGTPLARIQDGGMHEKGMRAGTINVSGIVGLGEAVSLLVESKSRAEEIRKLRDKLIKGVLEKIPDSKVNGLMENRLPNNANFSFVGVEGESVLMALDEAGIAVSTGSACAAEDMAPSHVLMAIGLTHLEAHSSIRITLGKYSTEKEVDKFLGVLPGIIEKFRTISGESAKAASKLPDDFGC